MQVGVPGWVTGRYLRASGAGVLTRSLLAMECRATSPSERGFSLVARVVEQDGGDGAAGRSLELTLGNDQQRVRLDHRGQDSRPLWSGEARLQAGRTVGEHSAEKVL